MKIAFVSDGIIITGGIITNFEYVSRLKKLGYEADIYANFDADKTLAKYYDIKVKNVSELHNFANDDIIIANWWPMVESLSGLNGRKWQFVQGRDVDFYHERQRFQCIEARNRKDWNLFAVSRYALEWTGRQGIIIPNGVHERFFVDYGLERDFDVLVEGNADDDNKNVLYSIKMAKDRGFKKIAWLGRDTKYIEEVERFTNPPQEEIPKIYQRAKHFFKHSKSEGFCLPLLEAMASGCIIETWDMGGNDFKPYTKENAQNFTWDNSVDKFIKQIINECRSNN